MDNQYDYMFLKRSSLLHNQVGKNQSVNSLNTRYAIRRQLINVPKRPDTPFGVTKEKPCKTSFLLDLRKQKDTCGLLRYSYNCRYTQKPSTLNATANTGKFFMIGPFVISIDKWHVSSCNSLLVHIGGTKLL